MIHLAHVTGWSKTEILDMDADELLECLAESVKYWNRMYAKPDE